ncbi:MAG: hypothetical protein ABI743_04710 [bacterium]
MIRSRIGVVVGTLLLSGCATGSPQIPSIPEFANTPAPTLGAVMGSGDLHQAAIGIWNCAIDPTSLNATVTLEATRAAEAAGVDNYLLDVGKFLRNDTIRVTSIGRDQTAVILEYSITHPFPAPGDPTAPSSATNRADLGFAGYLCFLADVGTVTGNTYFDEQSTGGSVVVANTALVQNPDAYSIPAGLLNTGMTANCFPFKTVVDERYVGSVVAHAGAWQPPFGGPYRGILNGWIANNLLQNPGVIGWGGYGVLHQGLTAVNRVRLDRAALAANAWTVRLALIAKYNDPRGGITNLEKRGNRLPREPYDVAQFAYRMPHGALDCDRILFAGASAPYRADQASDVTLWFRVEDWDVYAEEAIGPLADDLPTNQVALGESGLPTLAVCIPGILGDERVIDLWDPATTLIDDDTIVGGDPEPDLGYSIDPLCFGKVVTKPALSGQLPGRYTGMVRVRDPEDFLSGPLAIPLNGVTLAPLTSRLPHPVNYQAFQVDLVPTPGSCPEFGVTLVPTNGFLGPAQSRDYDSWQVGITPTAPPAQFAGLPRAPLTGIVGQVYNAPDNGNFYLFGGGGTDLAFQMTDFGSAVGGQVSVLACDLTNRVIFGTVATLFTNAGPAEMYANAREGLSYFDYNAAVVDASALVSLPTPGIQPVALATDSAGNLLMVDTANVLHRLIKELDYSEDLTGGFPVDLNGVLPAADYWVHGVAFNTRHQASFVVGERKTAATQDGWLLRVECDGTIHPLIDGQPNPANFPLNDTVAGDRGAEIFMDETNAFGNQLGSLADAQLVVFTGNIVAAVHVIRFNARLEHVESEWADGSATTFGISPATELLLQANGETPPFGTFDGELFGWR